MAKLINCEAWEVKDLDERVIVDLFSKFGDEKPAGHISLCIDDAEEFLNDLKEAIDNAKCSKWNKKED